MNTSDIHWRLARLASLPFQERYVIAGTKEEYVLSIELLEDVDGIKFLIESQNNKLECTSLQRKLLDELFQFIEKHAEEALSGSSREAAAKLIRESWIWGAFRAKSQAALQAFGLADTLSIEEIKKLSM